MKRKAFPLYLLELFESLLLYGEDRPAFGTLPKGIIE